MKVLACLIIPAILVVSCHRRDQTMFSALNASETHVEFANKLEKTERLNILYYLYYYNGGGVAIGDINNDGLPDIYFTANSKGHNKLYLNKGNFQFEDITEKAGVAGTSDWCTGVTMADVNGDGVLDIYVCAVANTHGLTGHNELFINNGNGHFTESGAAYGLNFSGFSTQAAFFDYDHDGDLDCYILNQSHNPHANIVDTSNRHHVDANSGDRLYRNDAAASAGSRKFTDVSAAAGIYQSNLGYGLGLAVADFNNDGWEDIYVGNDFHENDYYYLNNGSGSFTESGAQHFNHYSRFSMGNDAADFNNDGQLDIVTVDMLPPDEKVLKTYGSDEHFDTYNQKITHNGYQNQCSRNCLQRNNGNGSTFSDIGLISGISATDWSWSPLMADFDNDGNKDIFISSGIVKRPVDLDYIRFMSDADNHKVLNTSDRLDDKALEQMPDGASHPFLFKGDGDLHFADSSNSWGTGKMKGYFNGAAYADLDNDGNLDLVINCLNAPALILKNNTAKSNQLTISFKGDNLNTAGIGAKAYIFSRGKMQYQQMMPTRGFMSSSEPRLHFGVGATGRIDSLLVVWPDKRYQLIKSPAVNNPISVQEKDAAGIFDYNKEIPSGPSPYEDLTARINQTWRHREDPFNDFSYQYLIPHMESTRGPKLAVADVNSDGLDDLFVCGAKGQSGSLMIQTKNGHFVSTDSSVFAGASASEGVDAAFFDANGDGHPDLYVVSGGNEYEDGNSALADHLYLNDGKGHFTLASSNLPAMLTNKSTVAIADINNDGHPDIFVGGLANAKKFGYPSPSYLLLNDGGGNFKEAPGNIISLDKAGMITSSAFADLNNDGWPDLVIAGEWTPIRIYFNRKGIFTQDSVSHSSGLWQKLYITDVNGDGHPDLLAGNWGFNSKLSVGKNGPLKMYVRDFDNNGTTEQVMAYTIDGKEYTFLQKDELERALPVLKKAYLTYGEVAGKTVDYMFYDLFKDYATYTAEVLGSSCLINDGKGGFTRTDLSSDQQLSPIFCFAGDKDGYISGGNFFGVLPYEGQYDAASLTSFSLGGKTRGRLLHTYGQIRDIKRLHTQQYGDILVAARNNESLLFFKSGSR